MGARVDIVKQHAEEASFLYARLRRSHRLLDGNARQARALVARIDAHLDALTLFAHAAPGALATPLAAKAVGDRFVAVAIAAATDGVGLAELADATLGYDGHCAVRDAMLWYPTAAATRAVEGWLADGLDAARAVGVELFARWRDPRASKVASRAIRRSVGALRAAGVCAAARCGEPVSTEVALDAMRGCNEVPWGDAVLEATLRASTARALDVARRWDGDRSDLAWVLMGLTGDDDDEARLVDAFTMRGAVGALPSALALAGAHTPLADAWAESTDLAVSNAMREAAYVVLGGEAPPVVVRDDMAEEPEDRTARVTEDAALRERIAATSARAWRWGRGASRDELQAVEPTLGPRPRRWCLAALTLAGGTTDALWDAMRSGDHA